MASKTPVRASNGEFLPFTVDAALLKELGERLVGKPFVALAELVKNSYDADSTRCRITFGDDSIEVCDDGDGMTKLQFRDFWMRVGTTHKQQSPLTARLHRRVSGSKGVGRLSVQFLGKSMTLWSVPRDSPESGLRAEVDWTEAQASGSLINAGATIYTATRPDALPKGFSHGTRIRIRGLNQSWDTESLRGLARELWFLRPPAPIGSETAVKDLFSIELEGSAENERLAFDRQLGAAFRNWIAEIKGEITDGRKGGLAKVTVTFADGETATQKFKLERGALDQGRFQVRVYKLSGKQPEGISVHDAREYFRRFGGVHIYDQDFRLPFYGGDGEDWLRLEAAHSHRLMVSKLVPESLRGDGDLRDLPTNGRIFGIVKVSTSNELKAAPPSAQSKGAYLNVQVTRDRLVDNDALADLRDFVRWGLDFYSYLTSSRKQKAAAKANPAPKPAEPIFDDIFDRIAHLRAVAPPQLAAQVTHINARVEELQSIERGKEARYAREKVLLGALATAGMGSIALEHELGKEIQALRDSLDSVKNAGEELQEVSDALQKLLHRITSARRLLSPLMEPMNRDHEAELKAKAVVRDVVDDLKPLLRSLKVDISGIREDLKLPKATRATWSAILQNVLLNAMNATIDTRAKRVVVTGDTRNNGITGFLRIEDNGVGVDLDEADALFEPFERRLEVSKDRMQLGLGGVGLGLTIVRMVAESVGCSVRFVEPSRLMSTAFEISWEVKHDSATPPSSASRRRH